MKDPVTEWIRERVTEAYDTAREHLAAHPDEPGVKVDLTVKLPDGEVVTVTTLAIMRGDVGL